MTPFGYSCIRIEVVGLRIEPPHHPLSPREARLYYFTKKPVALTTAPLLCVATAMAWNPK